MASGLVKAALDSIVSDSIVAGLSERSQKVSRNMIELSSDLDNFAVELISALETTFVG